MKAHTVHLHFYAQARLQSVKYLLRGNSFGQNLISLWKRGQNFIFPVHEPLESHSVQCLQTRCVESEEDSPIKTCTIRTHGFCAHCFWFSLSLKTLRPPLTHTTQVLQRRGVCWRALFRTERVLPFPPFPPLSLSLSTFGKESDYRKWIKLRGWQLFTPKAS